MTYARPPFEIFRDPAVLRAHVEDLRRDGRRIAVVPTMGALHEGHLALLRAARSRADLVILTIFVNPTQFGPNEDLARYPRDLEGDLRACEEEGADIVFVPSVDEMYPSPPETSVVVPGLAATMEGASRPTHFAGVATVVAKLLNVAGPCRAYFGEKDYQQLVVVRRMTADLSFPVEVVGCPIVREADGLARSSRNVYLTPEERAAAPVLHRALQEGRAAIDAGERDAGAVAHRLRAVIATEPLAQVDYAEAVDPATLRPPERLRGEVRLLVAARFGRPRLLDNLAVLVPEQD